MPVEGPILSILIPAYNFPSGVSRVLDSLGPAFGLPSLEVIVSDDSSIVEHAEAIERIAQQHPRVIYLRNSRSLGAVHHWNVLLARARGRYCLLMHHDEYFETAEACAWLLARLSQANAPDGIVLSCKVVSPKGGIRRNMPMSLTKYVVNHWPGYLLHRNVLGAPSVLVLRKTMYESFDERLRWFVDIELYARAFVKHRPQLEFSHLHSVMSDLSLASSITNSLQGEIDALRRREVLILRHSSATAGRGAWLISNGVLPSLARALEYVAWTVFRAGLRGMQTLSRAFGRFARDISAAR